MGIIVRDGIPYGTSQNIIIMPNGDIYIDGQLVRKTLTQTEYDALTIKDPKVEYNIVEEE